MAKAKKYTYRIQYINDTYQIVDWTKAEYNQVGTAMVDCKKAVVLEDAIFKLDDIRAIVFLPPEPELTPEEKKAQAEGQLSEWGFVDADTAQWLKDHGIDLKGGGK